MAFALPNGSRVYVQKSKGSAVEFDAISNAKEAIVTLKTGTGL